MKLLDHVDDLVKGKTTVGKKRSSKWPGVRKDHLKINPGCAVCGGTEKVEVHHIHPFHTHPELELDPSNLITLCEGNPKVNCHLFVGHLGNYRNVNENVIKDAEHFKERFST